MGLGSQVHHRIRLMFAEHPIHLLTTADVNVLKGIPWILSDGLQRLEVPRIGELVDVDYRVSRIGNDVPNDG